jgi:hypothetical protein
MILGQISMWGRMLIGQLSREIERSLVGCLRRGEGYSSVSFTSQNLFVVFSVHHTGCREEGGADIQQEICGP